MITRILTWFLGLLCICWLTGCQSQRSLQCPNCGCNFPAGKFSYVAGDNHPITSSSQSDSSPGNTIEHSAKNPEPFQKPFIIHNVDNQVSVTAADAPKSHPRQEGVDSIMTKAPAAAAQPPASVEVIAKVDPCPVPWMNLQAPEKAEQRVLTKEPQRQTTLKIKTEDPLHIQMPKGDEQILMIAEEPVPPTTITSQKQNVAKRHVERKNPPSDSPENQPSKEPSAQVISPKELLVINAPAQEPLAKTQPTKDVPAKEHPVEERVIELTEKNESATQQVSKNSSARDLTAKESKPNAENSENPNLLDVLNQALGKEREKEQASPTKSMPIITGPKDHFNQVTGQLQQWRKIWRLRYATVETEDTYGGCIILEGILDSSKLREGQIVRVCGRLQSTDNRQDPPRYIVRTIEVLE